ncbi:hypothetical protein BC827DRAFT_1174206 [Russula dissimulans]|nr:hypothetical protein BC827DRAFT_1174206 [Russula dissimulans]
MLSLPLPLVLLVHIHLLGYPHADEPEYDQHVFDAKTRGLRDRTKTMEELSYFLVGKIEHKPRLKSLFPTYPCSQPSDSVAFRAVLTKYLEGLRNHVVRPETLSKFQRTSPDPWWWKDVVVRKSLLEECTGNRFERMIIALSTHALFANTSESLNVIASDVSAALTLLPTLPGAHVSLEARIHCARRAWGRSAALLQQRQADLKHPDSNATARCEVESNAMLAALSLGELVSLCESKRDLLQRGGWQGETGRVCLDFVVRLAGLRWPELPAADAERVDDSHLSSPEKISTNEDLLPPLPTAAAHHPQHMELFSSPVMQTSSGVTTDRRLSQTSDCGQTRNSTTRRVNGLQAKLGSIALALTDDASARAQSRNPSDVSVPPAPSKDDVTTETLTREPAARPPAPNQAARTGKGTAGRSAAFPLPKASRVRNQSSRPRIAAVPVRGSTQRTRQSKLGHAKDGLNRPARPAERPPPTAHVPKSSGAESSEAVAQEASGDHPSSWEARPITTTTQERKATYDFIEDDSAFFPSILKRDMVPMEPVMLRARRASVSRGSSRGSTPERGTTPYEGDGKDEDDWSYEGKSMTLRDILVRAGDATFAHFDILHEEDVDVADETLGWE